MQRIQKSKRFSISKTLWQVTLASVCIVSSVGCFTPIYSARPERRVQQLLYTSEDMRSLVEEWERFWHLDQPSHLTPIRTHGGLL